MAGTLLVIINLTHSKTSGHSAFLKAMTSLANSINSILLGGGHLLVNKAVISLLFYLVLDHQFSIKIALYMLMFIDDLCFHNFFSTYIDLYSDVWCFLYQYFIGSQNFSYVTLHNIIISFHVFGITIVAKLAGFKFIQYLDELFIGRCKILELTTSKWLPR